MKRARPGRVAGRLVRWLLISVVGLVLVGFLGSNLVMGSGWFRGRVARKLVGETRLLWTVGEASWSPWGGVRLGGLKAEAVQTGEVKVDPVCEIEEVRVHPYWGALLSGQLAVREVRVKSPRGKVPLELLAELMKADGRVEVAEVKVPGQSPPGAGDLSGEPGANDPEPEVAGPDDSAPGGDAGASGGAEKDKPAGGKAKPEVSKPPPGRSEQPGRLIVENGELQVYTLAHPEEVLVVTEINLDLPIAGNEATGWFENSGVQLGDHQLVEGVRIPVMWKKPVLRLAPMEAEWNGLKFRLLAALRIRGRVTGSMEVRGLPGALSRQSVPGWSSMNVSAEQVESLARWSGDLARPGSWTGNLVGVVKGVRFQHVSRGDPVMFDSGQVVVDLRGGVVQVPDVRLMGERLSFMGNSVALMDGRAVAVLRIVADPEYAEKAVEVASGSMIGRGFSSSWLLPLETPDRFYRDIHLQGTFPAYTVDVGRKGEQADLLRTVQQLVTFVKGEQREELLRGPIPPGGAGEGGQSRPDSEGGRP